MILPNMSQSEKQSRREVMTMNEDQLHAWEDDWKQYRPFLVSFAYRMTGSLSEAEDLVQDTFLECARVPRTEVRNAKSWLTKICANKGIDHLRSAYKRRETYPGTWLPDVVPDSLQIWSSLQGNGSPEKQLIASESLTTSFLLLVERLTPEERAVYLLSEVFEYSYREIAALLEKSEDACRKTAQRARAAIVSAPKFESNSPASIPVIERFFEVAKAGDSASLVEMLSDESEFWSDGGGKVAAAKTILTEKTKIAGFFAALGSSKSFTPGDFKLDFTAVSSRPGLIISRRLPSGLWNFETIFCFEIRGNKIARIYAQRNPDKLKPLLSELENR
jgi:RNA polymerase sigma-70 factor (ECF subfamily)